MKLNQSDRVALSCIDRYWIDPKTETGIGISYNSGKFTLIHTESAKDRREVLNRMDEYFKGIEE